MEIAQRKFDTPLLLVALALAGIGIVLIYSAGQLEVESFIGRLYLRQVLWLGVAVAAGLVLFAIPLGVLETFAPLLYLGTLAALGGVLLAPPTAGAHRWFSTGAFQIQPAEFAKIVIIIALARYLSSRRKLGRSLLSYAPALLLALVPAALILIEPDLGTTLVLIPILFGMLYWAGAPLLHLFLLASPLLSVLTAFSTALWAGLLGLVLLAILVRKIFLSDALLILGANVLMGVATVPLWEHLEPYQRTRLISFLHPGKDPLGASWQSIQSQVAIGSGGLWGKGFLKGTQKSLAFLPEQHTDFIFSLAGEEFGFLGACVILGLFLVILWRAIDIARRAPSPFASLLCFGVAALWATQIAINIAMTVGLLPITGLPLPFLSYGGSFLVVCFVGMGLLERCSHERRTYWAS